MICDSSRERRSRSSITKLMMQIFPACEGNDLCKEKKNFCVLCCLTPKVSKCHHVSTHDMLQTVPRCSYVIKPE